MSTVAFKYVGGLIGNAIGFAIGGPYGGWLGGKIGAGVGAGIGFYTDYRIVQALTPGQRIEPPPMDELRVTSAAEGAVIPFIIGSWRTTRTELIWATDRRVEETTSEQGGKGGPKVEVTDRRYFCSFAVALCEGPITGVGRIWADGKPFAVPGAVYRVYLGTETQEPDEAIEAIEGVGNVEAFRGTAYVVFDDLPLESFGNRIPQLSFEVFAPPPDESGAGELLTAVNMIPASGEQVYSTEVARRNSKTAPLNVNSTDARPDMLVSLDQLQAAAPNIAAVSLVVSWFGVDLRCADCEIKPGVELPGGAFDETVPQWLVNGVERGDAYLISRVDNDPANGPNYGGTPTDSCVVEAIQEMRDVRGLKVCFYPFVLMDVPPWNTLPNPYSDNASEEGQPAFPWRGRITCSPAAGYVGTVDQTATAASQVAAFFGSAEASDFDVDGEAVSWTGGADWGYRRMILHYAHLCAAAGGVDSFLIGSELRGLTWIRSDASTYPAVAELIDLAAEVRSIFDAASQTSTKISYAADWSEYFGHRPDDGSDDVYFHLDPLWADSEIDFVGIDNYMPLSDWRDGTSHLDAQAGAASIYDLDYLQANIEGGEGFDWRYADQAARDSQTRTTITDAAYAKPWVFRTKDVRSWWSEEHFNRPGGVEAMSATAWVPESKPIRFTEAGCPAVDKGTNQPNVFFDPKSSESFLPYYSRAGGVRDDAIQRRYIEALYSYWAPAAGNNPTSGVYAGLMVDPEIYIWTWDARPYPAFPSRTEVWADGPNWRLGHWVTGRLGGSSLGSTVAAICARAGVPPERIDVSALSAVVLGYEISAIESARVSLAILMAVYGFDAVESDGVIRFAPRGGAPAATITDDDLVANPQPEGEDFELTRGQETELARALRWRLIEPNGEFGALTVESRRITADTARIGLEQFPIVMPADEAGAKVRRALRERWLDRDSLTLALPPSKLALEGTDVILHEHDGRLIEYRLGSITDGDARACEAARTDAVLYTLRPGPERTPSLPAPVVFDEPTAVIMDLPQLDEQVPAHRPLLAVHASPWYGRAAVYRSPAEDGFALLTTVRTPAFIGELAFDLHSGPVGRFDHGNELYVDLLAGALASVTDLELFAGANALAVESEAGVWEVVQFGAAELEQPGRYKCTRLLRGQRGTEGAMRDPAPAGARVVVLNTALATLPIGLGDLGLPYNWRIGPATAPVGDDTFTSIAFTPAGIGLRPFSPCHVSQPWKTPHTPGDLTITAVRRTRDLSGDSWELAEVPLEDETFELDVLDGEDVIRTLTSATLSFLYTGAAQTADWGAPLAATDELDVRVYALSAQYGRGAPLIETLFF